MYYVGIDLGGTAIKGGIVDENAKIILKKEVKTPVEAGYEGVIGEIISLINSLLDEAKLNTKDIKSIGIGIPGVASKEGLVYYAHNLFWKNVPLSDMLKKEFKDLPIYVENDATVACVAEYACGAMKDKKTGVMLTLGTGVGGGIIIDGKVFSGSHGLGSEIGHMVVGENFYDCNCGKNGCLETFSSATAIINYAKKLIKEENKDTLIMEKVQNDMEKIDAKVIIDSAKEGDYIANKAVDNLVKYLAIGITNIMNIIDPEVICIGGGLSKSGNFLLNKINSEVSKYLLFKDLEYGKIVIGKLENDGGIIGSAMLGK
ncbi:glucokinase [Alkalithermobacter thermoalcaliphilus JW-YL-7 = DSM 7308]|uniref:Glucokinase n=1 Tax=Alkalithermobacter thermoalcaliphilus JW-YL-7 = DSM 7308 TaxID=1121328 RepID=A0A150FSC0_CLOPD|nr:glucokinase, ROK family [[Clostridium] paradoxum JW-YL-7 = DSM 7308]SHL16321.1 glucokinase [[Clostridium] paradoxum JW-YL-7 = DSM 7308]